jgi:hypothetical protein
MPRASEKVGAPQPGGGDPQGQAGGAPPAGRRRGRLRLALRIALNVAGLLVLIVLLAGGYLAWRLSEGRFDIAFLKPQIEAALSSTERGLAVEIGGAEIGYDHEERTIDIVGRDVRVRDRDNRLLVAVPDIALSFSLRAALRGTIAPTRLVIREPSFRLRREADGRWMVAVSGGDDGETNAGDELAALIEPPAEDRSLGLLREVTVRGASLLVDDRMAGRSWSARNAAASFFRTEDGIRGGATLAVDLGGTETDLRLGYRYTRTDKRLVTDLSFTGLDPHHVAAVAPGLEALDALQAPIGGTIRIAASLAPLRIEGRQFELTIGPGVISRAELPNGTVPIRGGTVKADYDPDAKRLHLFEASLDLYGPSLAISGTIDGLDLSRVLAGVEPKAGGGLTIAAGVTARAVPVDALDTLWPKALAVNARNWVVANVRDGIADEARLDLHAKADSVAGPVIVESLGGTLRYHDLTVYYRRPLPPVRAVAGTATFDRSRFDLVPSGGSLMGLRVVGGTVSLTALDTRNEAAAIEIAVVGPVRDALTVIDTKPFEYAKEIGIDPARSAGTADARLAFRFPLVRDLTFEQIELSVRAQLAEVAIQNMLFKSDLAGGTFDLDLDRSGLRLKGGATLGGIPTAASVAHVFKPKDGVKTRAAVWAAINREGRRRLGLDFLPDMLDGTAGVDLLYSSLANKRADLSVTLDLKDARVTAALLGYEKPPGILGAAKLDIDLRDDRVVRIRDAVLKSAGLDVRATVAFAETTQDLQRIEFKRLTAGDTDLNATATKQPDGGWRIEFSGAAFDASALLKSSGKDDDAEQPPLTIDGRVERLIVGPKREARNVGLQLASDRRHWQNARLDGELPGGSKISLRFGQTGGARPFTFTGNDFGGVLQLLGISESIVGGQIQVSGNAEDDGPKRIYRGHADAVDYRLYNAPAFAKLLSLASLTSFTSLLSGDGLPFARLSGDFTFADGKLGLKDTRAYGGALGINAEGTVDLVNDVLDLDGTLVPAYTINSILGYVPFLGKALLGGEGQGLFAANFHASGPLDDPKISVNPLSALAPGFLRRLFVFDGANSGAAPTNEPLQKLDR